MDHIRWTRIRTLFESAAELPREGWRSYLEGACSDDPSLVKEVLAMLEEDYSRISAQLGCSAGERIIAIVQSREQYMRGTSAAEWSGGHYDGRIHVAWTGESDLRPRMERALAQKLSGDELSPSDRAQLRQGARDPSPRNLGQDWFSMSQQQAVAAYKISQAAVDALYDNNSLRKILTNPETLPSLTADLDSAFGL